MGGGGCTYQLSFQDFRQDIARRVVPIKKSGHEEADSD
jgi:hypothetical protein